MAQAKLIAYTQSAIEECDNLTELVAYMARVSNPDNQANHETSKRLLDYLKRHSHWSPFEMVNIVIEVKTTRDIAHQMVRHRSFVFQEFSQRYAAVPPTMVPREFRLQDKTNRQNSIALEDKNDIRIDAFEWSQVRIWSDAMRMYQRAIDAGVAKEQARALLPEGLTPTTLYMNGTLRSWIHYCDLRMANGTQEEHKAVANLCWKIVSNLLGEEE